MSSSPNGAASIRAAAIHYARSGMRPIRVRARGKAPVDLDWSNVATTDMDQVAERFQGWDGNIGIAMGSGTIIDIEVDPYHGGDDGLLALEMKLGPLPDTWSFLSGRGGRHLLFKHPGFKVLTCANLGAELLGHDTGVDCRGDGGQSVAPPSIHENGSSYRWTNLHPGSIDLAELPDGWRAYLRERADRPAKPTSAPGTTPPPVAIGRHDWVLAQTRKLARLGFSIETIVAAVAAEMPRQCDLSDGRAVDIPEITRAARGAVAAWSSNEVSEEAHGAEVAAVLIAEAEQEAENSRQIIPQNYFAPQNTAPAVHTNRLADPGELPRDLCELPGLGGLWLQAIDRASILPQPELAVGAVLAACGSLIGRRLALGRGRANLYLFGIAETGHGKDAARDIVKQVLREAALDGLYEEKIKSDSGIVSALVQDPTKLFLLDEAGYLIAAAHATGAKNFQAGILEVLLQLYTSAHTMWKAGVYADPKKNPTIDQPHVCMYATSTPGKLFGGFTTESLDGGLLGRCLAVWGATEKPRRRRPGPVALDSQLIEGVRAWATQGPRQGSLASRNIDPDQVPIDADALEHFDQATDSLDDLERGELKGQPSKPLFTRVVQTAERIALIRAWCRDQIEPRVMREDADWAVRFALQSARRMAYHAGDRIAGDNSPFERAYMRVLAVIRAGGNVTRNDLRRQVRLPARFIDEIIASAVEAGEIAEEIATPDPGDYQGGRAITIYKALS